MSYVIRTPERLALASLEAQRDGIRAVLLEGPPGCGKTELARHYAAQLGGELVYAMLHSWTDDGELFAGVDVVAAVAGDAARVHRPGSVAIAAEISHHRAVVLCLDEIDKAPERVEYLLLDVLQTGRVPVRPGVHILADARNLRVVLTTNGVRDLSDALLRRVQRCRMSPLSSAQIVDLLAARGFARPVVTMATKAAYAVAAAEGGSVSLSEIARFVDAIGVASTYDELRELCAQCIARTAKGHTAALAADLAPLWAEVVLLRRRAA